MANILAAQSGNWSATSTWTGGVLPGVNDVAFANGFTVTIDQNISVVELSNQGSDGASQNGTFDVVTIPGTRTLTFSGVLGSLTVGRVSSWPLITVNAASGTLVIDVERVTGGPPGGNGWRTCRVLGACNIVCTGDVYGVVLPSGNAGGAGAFVLDAAATLTVQGDAYGSNGSAAIGVSSSAAVVDIQGTAYAHTTAAALEGNNLANRVTTLVDAANGRKAVYAPGWLMENGALHTETIMSDTLAAPFTPGSQVVLANYVSDSPPPADVRSGLVYGPSDTLTGTMAIPAATSVQIGVPVDATVGSATISLADIAAVTGAQVAAVVSS